MLNEQPLSEAALVAWGTAGKWAAHTHSSISHEHHQLFLRAHLAASRLEQLTRKKPLQDLLLQAGSSAILNPHSRLALTEALYLPTLCIRPAKPTTEQPDPHFFNVYRRIFSRLQLEKSVAGMLVEQLDGTVQGQVMVLRQRSQGAGPSKQGLALGAAAQGCSKVQQQAKRQRTG